MEDISNQRPAVVTAHVRNDKNLEWELYFRGDENYGHGRDEAGRFSDPSKAI